MALKRATKSIPLSGGIVEEVDDFLLEPAGMQYLENGRFTKRDMVEKARSYADGVVSGCSNYTPNIYGLWSDGSQKAAAIANNEVCVTTDAGASFTTQTLDHDLLGMERVLAVAEQQGGANYSCAPIGIYVDTTIDTYAISVWIVAFERINHNVGAITNFRDVVIQTYLADGTLVDEVIETNHNAPQCYELGNGFAGVVYSQSTGNLKSRLASSSGGISSINNNDSLNIQQYCQYLDKTSGKFDGLNYGDLRMGWGVDLQDNNGALTAYHSAKAAVGMIAFKDESAGDLKYRFMTSGYPQGSSYTVIADAAGVITNSVLDCFIEDSGLYAYVLYGQHNVISNDWDIFLAQITVATPAVTHTVSVVTGEEYVPVNGSVRQASDGSVYTAVTRAFGYPNKTMQDTLGLSHVLWRRYTGGDPDWSVIGPVVGETALIRNHRLCSNIACDKDDDAGIVVQQWDNWNPADQTVAGTDQNIYTLTSTAKKPVTSVMVKIGMGTPNNEVMATFDAGQSKAQLFGQDEQSIHKSGNLYYFSNDPGSGEQYNRWHYGNRIIQTSDDTVYWMDRTAAPTSTMPGTPNSDARVALLAGSSRFSVYHINSTVDVHSVNFPDGAILGTSVPAWYDAKGNTIMSSGPTESPEITSVTAFGGTDGCSYNAYTDLGVANEEAKVYTALWVFSDAAGRVHRSAPSVPMYVGKLQADRTNTTRIVISLTAPLMLQRTRGTLQVEVYEALPGEVPQLCATEDIPAADLDGSSVTSVQVGVNMNPTATASAETDIVEFRASKIIYTAGNVLAADPWPNFDAVVESGRRLFAHSIGDPNTIYFSKTFEQNVAPEFSAALTVTLGNQVITALATVDDKVLIFTATGVWLMYGPGPDNTGANGDFFVDRLPFKTGCTEQRSVLPYEEGVAFYSNTTKEYHVITRDLLLVDLGESVKGLSESIVDHIAAVVATHDHELRWYVDLGSAGEKYLPAGSLTSPPQPPRPRTGNQLSVGSGECFLVYSYKYKKWSVRTHNVTIGNGICKGAAVVVDGQVSVLSRSYVFRRESDANWTTAELMVWETPWIKVNQLQDFGRFYAATFLGKYLSSWDDPIITDSYEAGDLQVTISYDYEGEGQVTDVHRFRANQDFNPDQGERIQFRIRPDRQKCQAIKFLITEIPTEAIEVWEPTYTTGRGLILTAVDLHYGAKGGSGYKNLGSKRRKG